MAESLPHKTFAGPSGMAPAVIDRNRALLREARQFQYKTIREHALEAHVFFPPEGASIPPRSAIVFFFSGTWDAGLISQFAPHCMHFAHRGMVAILADYRVSSRHDATPLDGIADAKSAIRWVRLNAEALGVNPDRVAAGGGAAGAHLATCAAMVEGFDDPQDDLSISCQPNALILFSPFLDVTRKGFGLEKFPDKKLAKQASPMHHVRRRLQPMLIFHGTHDRVVPFETSKKFVSKMRWRRNKCRLSPYEGQGHGFFNFNVDASFYERTLYEADQFLVEHGFLQPNEDDDGTSRLT